MEDFKLSSIEAALEDFKEGKFVIVVDDEDRENEGDLIIAAEKITPEKVNFMLKNARGVLCAPVTLSRCEELDLPHQGAGQHVDARHAVYGHRRQTRGVLHGRVGSRPCGHYPGPYQPRVHTADLRSPRPHQPALRSGQRCAAP